MRLSTKGRYAVMAMADLARRQGVLGEGDRAVALSEIAARQQNAPATAATDKPDVGSQSDDFPLVAATGVFLAQANHVAQMQFHIHRRHYSTNGFDILHWQNDSICPIMERYDRMALRR